MLPPVGTKRARRRAAKTESMRAVRARMAADPEYAVEKLLVALRRLCAASDTGWVTRRRVLQGSHFVRGGVLTAAATLAEARGLIEVAVRRSTQVQHGRVQAGKVGTYYRPTAKGWVTDS